jgi:hypothetical protein
VEQLRELHPGLPTTEARVMAHATFGLLNSTPHSARLSETAMRELLERMALGALEVPR